MNRLVVELVAEPVVERDVEPVDGQIAVVAFAFAAVAVGADWEWCCGRC